jgi:N-methylhydantoinase A/oxoprolinase/acetone carboxylase beta subunit
MTSPTNPRRIGLGIDAGGTYTDLALFDFAANALLDKAKTPTTHWDVTLGVRRGLEALNEELLRAVQLVSVSTTLATNAVVENRGQKVGLLIMPQQGLFDPGEIGHHPQAILEGRMDINGHELEPVRPEEVRDTARAMVEDHGISAFALSGYAGSVNPIHEIQVKHLVREATGLSVTCGHELSAMLNFITRARTAVINARIIPFLESFLADLEQILLEHGTAAPIAVVKGDGSLMSLPTALERPVETVLSGPAASVAGGRKLTGVEDALVVDMGGTTTDVAAVRHGSVQLCDSGALLGCIRTHVRAIDVTTSGLGGDSRVLMNKGQISIGPERVTPLCRAQAQWPSILKALDFMEFRLDDHPGDSRWMDILCLAGDQPEPGNLTPEESAILVALNDRPRSLPELAEKCRALHWSLLNLERLELRGVIARCALTPTDLLHIRDQVSVGSQDAPQRMLGLLSRLTKAADKDLVATLVQKVIQSLARDIFLVHLSPAREASRQQGCRVCSSLLEAALGQPHPDFAVSLSLTRPLVGIGAPAEAFLSMVGERLHARTIIPEHAEVANAIGAITSSVHVEKEVQIKPWPEGRFSIAGVSTRRVFDDLEAATQWAMDHLDCELTNIARTNGASRGRVDFEVQDRRAATGDGSSLFLGRVVIGTVKGKPGAADQLAAPTPLSGAACGSSRS